MKHPTILVTGATGKTGAAVVAQLREKDFPVRAMVRSQDARSERLKRLGAEVVVADLFDFDQLLNAMKGTQRAYYCPPFHPYMIQSATAFAVAAREASLESIVGLSQWLASPVHPSLSTRQHWLVDRMFSTIPGMAYTTINPGLFASYPYLRMMPYAAQLGLFPMPGDGKSRNAPPSDEDIARVSVAALIDPDTHGGKTYRPTGPEVLSIEDMTQILGRVLGRTVRHVPIPMWLFFKALRADGTSPVLMSGLRYYVQEHSSGTFAFGAPTDHVFEVTGQRPESFETIARRYAALPEAKRTAGSLLTAFAKFMVLPFLPGFDPAKFEREMEFPMPPTPQLDMESARWRSEHGAQAATLPPANAKNSATGSPLFSITAKQG